MPALSPDSVLARNERLSWRILDDEAVILFPDEGTLHRLNGTGTRVWELIDGARSIAELGGLITDEFEVASDEAVTDLCTLAGELVEAKLAEVVG